MICYLSEEIDGHGSFTPMNTCLDFSIIFMAPWAQLVFFYYHPCVGSTSFKVEI